MKNLYIILIMFSMNFVYSQVNCTDNNGIQITTTGSQNNAEHSAGVLDFCSPIASYAGNNGVKTFGTSGSITYTFSQPIISAKISYSGFNNTPGLEDIGTLSIDGTGNLTLSDSCAVIINGNQITGDSTVTTEEGFSGDVSLRVSSTCPFTTITFLYLSGVSGAAQGNPCNFEWTSACDIPAPVLSNTSLSNICPNDTVDLNQLNILGACGALTWHTETPATASNLVSPSNAVGEGTYYAAFSFSDGQFVCYSPTTAVVVTIIPCNPDCLPDATLISPDHNVSNISPFTDNTEPLAVREIQTTGFINATNIIEFGDNTVQQGVVYTSETEIYLNDGFETLNDAQFAAYIDYCEDDTVYRLVDGVKNQEETSNEDGIKIFPNPSSNLIMISSKITEFDKIIIYNLNGKSVLDSSISKRFNLELNINNLKSGLYFVSIIDIEGHIHRKKLIKN